MQFYADACFLIGLFDPNDKHSHEAQPLWRHLIDNRFVEGFNNLTLSYMILVEAFQCLQKNIEFNRTLEAFNVLTHQCQCVNVTEDIIQKAISNKLSPLINHRTNKPWIGLTDAISLVIMDQRKIPFILSYDGGYDKIPLTKRIYNVESALQIG
ncbi:MAG: hypothetical protein HZB92_06760 [Euryarchaeota archaeon]|nr:hypothetical protein [Euryarchaeota archaeon]